MEPLMETWPSRAEIRIGQTIPESDPDVPTTSPQPPRRFYQPPCPLPAPKLNPIEMCIRIPYPILTFLHPTPPKTPIHFLAISLSRNNTYFQSTLFILPLIAEISPINKHELIYLKAKWEACRQTEPPDHQERLEQKPEAVDTCPKPKT